MPISAGPNIITNELVLAVDAADKNSYPGSGTTWYDVSGKNNNCTLINGISYSSTNKGTMVLDGTNDVIYAPSVNSLGGLSEQALEIWVKSPGLGPGASIGGLICPDYGQISYIEASGNVVYYLYNTDTSPYNYLFIAVSSGVNVFDNKWHHIVCTRNTTNYNIYIDGVSRASGNGGGIWSGSTIWSSMVISIGNNPNNVGYNLYGNIAITNIYKSYLSQEEVLQNYQQYKTRFNL